MNTVPTISVITICFNNLDELKVTMDSVDKQIQQPFEHWIIDGSTRPDIKNYLESNKQPSYRKWLCERDKGISDAFNKGVLRATGEIVNMLNSADYYIDENTLSIVTDEFTEHSDINWLHGKYQLKRGGIWVTIGKPFEFEKLYRGMRSLAHQSMFVRKSLHDKYGLYDTGLTISMDYDFVCRIAQEPFVFVQQPLIVFTPDGTSQRNYLEALKQGKMVYERHFGSSLKLNLWQIRLKGLYYLLKSPVGGLLYKVKVWMKLENM